MSPAKYSLTQRRIDKRLHFHIETSVIYEGEIDQNLLKWGVSSSDQRRRLAEAIKLAAAKSVEQIPLPKKGELPLYLERTKHPELANMDVVDFLRTVWGKWIAARVLTRTVLSDYDPRAERALRLWRHKHNKSLPTDLYIPTTRQLNDERIALGEAADSHKVATLLAARHKRARKRAQTSQARPQP